MRPFVKREGRVSDQRQMTGKVACGNPACARPHRNVDEARTCVNSRMPPGLMDPDFRFPQEGPILWRGRDYTIVRYKRMDIPLDALVGEAPGQEERRYRMNIPFDGLAHLFREQLCLEAAVHAYEYMYEEESPELREDKKR